MLIGWIQTHSFSELIARGIIFPDFQQRISQILSNRGTIWREHDGLLKSGDGPIVILQTKRIVGLLQRLICGVGTLGGRKTEGRHK